METANSSTATGASLPSGGGVPLESVIITSELYRRPFRPADYETESRTLASMLEETDTGSGDVMQRLAELALSLCGAHSAGISLLQETAEGVFFRWRAVAGQWSRFVGGTMPRASSPCGTVLDRDASVLIAHPELHFPLPPELTPPVVEVLLIPFHIGVRTMGTFWVIAHDESRKFDSEDERLLISLSKFASTACQLLDTQTELRANATENARLYEEASAAHRSKDEFFATLSHELRGPLTAVMGWSDLLARNPNPETATEAARAITTSASVQAQLVDDLLDISRMMTGKLAIFREDTDLHAIVDDAVTSFRPLAASKAVALRFEASDSVIVSGEAKRLQQVMGNLLSNAIRFTPAGGVIVATLRREGNFGLITISDSGEGIPAQFLPHVFERYRQLGNSKHGGLGLGLAIVKHIVELHGGTVVAESPGADGGSTFSVRIPARGTQEPMRP